jgi:aldehyde:ferredoxin oxidoreductase
MPDLYGYTGKILMVDLSAENITTVSTENYLPKWVGGRGIGAKIHWDMVAPGVKAFDPENVLTFMTGAGTGIVDGRVVVQTVSPLGYPMESYYRSTMGSFFGSELKWAGWDGIVFVGKAAKLSYLLIEDDQVSIRDGNELYQLDTYATQQHLWVRHTSEHKVCLIGPAGENLVRDAHIQAGDHNACGLGGFGSVMGSKNLKAIVVRGTLGSPPIASVDDVMAVRLLEAQMMEPFPGVGAAAGSMLELAGQTGEARLGMAACFGCNQPCGYAVKYRDGSTVAMGSVKCGEFISCSAELQVTGEYVGKN